jgi:hypothetical protein
MDKVSSTMLAMAKKSIFSTSHNCTWQTCTMIYFEASKSLFMGVYSGDVTHLTFKAFCNMSLLVKEAHIVPLENDSACKTFLKLSLLMSL